MTENANPGLGIGEGLFKDLFWDLSVQAALTALFAYVPVLNVWPLRGIVTGIITLFTDKMYSLMKLLIDVTAIKFTNGEHQRAFDSAAVKLKIIAHDRGIDSDEFRKAREDAKASLSRFVRFGDT